jgi:Tfp pilus assembly protein PilF
VIANSEASAEVKETPAALLAQAHTAQASNDFEKAAYLFGAVLEQEPANKRALFGKACSHLYCGSLLQAQGKLVEAAEHYEAALKINPNDADTHFNYGILLKAQGKVEEAAEHFGVQELTAP